MAVGRQSGQDGTALLHEVTRRSDAWAALLRLWHGDTIHRQVLEFFDSHL